MGKGPKIKQDTFDQAGNLTNWSSGESHALAAQAKPGLKSASDFYSGLLSGGKGAQNLVAPSAMQIGQVYGGNARTLQNFMPAGGERNLALAQNQQGRTRSIADLYANVQPMAAQNLALLGLNTGQLGASFGGVANQGFGSLIDYQSQRNQAKAQAMGGIGGGLGKIGGMMLGPTAPQKPWFM